MLLGTAAICTGQTMIPEKFPENIIISDNIFFSKTNHRNCREDHHVLQNLFISFFPAILVELMEITTVHQPKFVVNNIQFLFGSIPI